VDKVGNSVFAFFPVTALPILLLAFGRAISNGSTPATHIAANLITSYCGAGTPHDALLFLLRFALGYFGCILLSLNGV